MIWHMSSVNHSLSCVCCSCTSWLEVLCFSPNWALVVQSATPAIMFQLGLQTEVVLSQQPTVYAVPVFSLSYLWTTPVSLCPGDKYHCLDSAELKSYSFVNSFDLNSFFNPASICVPCSPIYKISTVFCF